MSTPTLLEHLEDLTTSPGWEWLRTEWAGRMWSDAHVVAETRRIMDRTDLTSDQKTAQLEQMMSAKAAVERIFQAPHEKLAHLRQQVKDARLPEASRRGRGL